MDRKVALVTGGGKGIGKAICLHLAKHGYDIVLNYSRTLPDTLQGEIEAHGVSCAAFQADVSDCDQAKALCDFAVSTFGQIDVLVNNAGITKDNLILRMSEQDFCDVLRVNLNGTFYMTKYASAYMLKKRSGAIVNISSVVGVSGNAGQANYAASKAGIIGLTKTTARELGGRNITCNAVAPGFIETDMTENLPDKIKETVLANVPLKRMGGAQDVADAVLFLAESKYITGQVLHVDGGFVMS